MHRMKEERCDDVVLRVCQVKVELEGGRESFLTGPRGSLHVRNTQQQNQKKI